MSDPIDRLMLNDFAKMAFHGLWHRGSSRRDHSISVAYAVGSFARRKGISARDLSRWLQESYGAIWVRLSGLQPGADLKEIRFAMLMAHGEDDR